MGFFWILGGKIIDTANHQDMGKITCADLLTQWLEGITIPSPAAGQTTTLRRLSKKQGDWLWSLCTREGHRPGPLARRINLRAYAGEKFPVALYREFNGSYTLESEYIPCSAPSAVDGPQDPADHMRGLLATLAEDDPRRVAIEAYLSQVLDQ